ANADGTLTYTPNAGFTGTDSFTYRASDGALESEPATVTVTVEAPPSVTVQFQQGLDGYAGTADTYLREAAPGTSLAGATTLNIDSSDGGGKVQTVLRFDDLFGDGAGQIPLGATILSASLEVQTTSKGDGATLHRMLQPWRDDATWDGLENGIQADGVEAMTQADLDTGFVGVGSTRLDVTSSLQAWADGELNLGWAFLPTGSDGWDFDSAEGSSPPRLIVEYSVPEDDPTNGSPLANDDSVTLPWDTNVQIVVLANDSDPDDDPLTLGTLTAPTNGTLSVQSDGTLIYTPGAGFSGTDSFTYRASDGRLLSSQATVSIIVAATGEASDTSFIATDFGTSDKRNFSHTNATKSFYHDGEWWSVLPDESGWHVYRFDGPIPEPGTLGGWTMASPTMLTSGRRADIAWHDETDTLYVLNFGPTESAPRLFKLGYDTITGEFQIQADIQLAGTEGKLTGAEWQQNTEMTLGLDQNGNPLVSLIGPSSAGGEGGLKLAFPTDGSLDTWNTTLVDSGPTTVSASNGDNKVDFVAFQIGGVDHVGFVYGDSATGLWKLAYQTTPTSSEGYASGWVIETITDAIGLDDHLAALWADDAIIMTMKDDQDAIWAVKGVPGNWEAPVLVHDASHEASRPTLAFDEDNDQIFIFYQEKAVSPYGDIHFKTSPTAELSFDANDPGARFVSSDSPDENMIDPQMPTHSVGESTGGEFFVFARNAEAKEIWYNDFSLAEDVLIA
ncbi:MAG: Ig-like domain-containing protein, partial [Halomonas sp.]|nr:Ig-like domain-containing protein [Halomonas sp.]